MIEVLTIEELRTRMDAMRAQRRRGFSIQMFAKFAGVDYRNLKKMFFEKNEVPITNLSQRKLSRALLALEKGEAGMRIDIAGRKKLDYHPPKDFGLTLRRGYQINFANGTVGLTVKPVNKYDFNKQNLLKKGR
jgi:hypothetical protein